MEYIKQHGPEPIYPKNSESWPLVRQYLTITNTTYFYIFYMRETHCIHYTHTHVHAYRHTDIETYISSFFSIYSMDISKWEPGVVSNPFSGALSDPLVLGAKPRSAKFAGQIVPLETTSNWAGSAPPKHCRTAKANHKFITKPERNEKRCQKKMPERTHKIAENPSSQEQCEHPASIVW